MPDPLAKLRQETDAALATEVMGWELVGDWWLRMSEACRAECDCPVSEWRPTEDWGNLGDSLDVATGPGGFVRRFWAAKENNGSWVGCVSTQDYRDVFTGYGSTKQEALANALLKAARARKVDTDG